VNIRRPRHVFIRLADVPRISIDDLVRGEVNVSLHSVSLASTPAVPGERALSFAEIRLLSSVPTEDWIAAGDAALRADVDTQVVDELVDKGLLLTDSDDPQASAALEREDRYARSFWNPFAAFCHFNLKWRDRVGDLKAQRERIRAYDEPSPDPYFDHPSPVQRITLNRDSENGPLHQLLRSRRTTRAWTDEPLALSDLSAILEAVHGTLGESTGSLYPAIKKTSPSGGAMHPVEVFPVVRNVEGLSPGFYHYNVRTHSLDLVKSMDRDHVEKAALTFLAGQDHFTGAAFLCIMAVRFYRHNWKYRAHHKAYKVVLMDAAHLSQTFYLVCAERGLGAFFTGAINEENIEEALGLDPLEFGVVGINGCGHAADHDPLALRLREMR
jgi:putative peptide maturation dehydrogenase